MLKWTWEWVYLFKTLISFLLHIYSEGKVVCKDHNNVVLFLIFWGTVILFSIISVPTYILTLRTWRTYAKWNKQTQKDKCCMNSYVESETVRLIKTKSIDRMVVTRGWGKKNEKKGDADQGVQSFSNPRWVSSGDLRYNNLTIINHMVLHTWNMQRE